MKRNFEWVWIVSLAFCSQVCGQNVISTIVGYGSSGYSGDGGAATSASIEPSGVTVDAAGNLFIADGYNCRVRKIATNGVITTVAGKGICGFSGDGGAATSASLNYPSGVTVDSAGNLFISESYNHRIRKVTTSGLITTIAGNGNNGYSGDGGPAIAASLNFPSALAFDSAGNLFIADSNNQRIRKVSTAGIISTVAGNGSSDFTGDGGPATAASFNYPSGVAVDSAGNIFVSDTYNHRIRMISSGGVISTFAGNGADTFSGDGGPAASAGLRYPYGVAIDPAGNLLIADSSNYRLRQVTGGVITTVAGNGIEGFSGDLGPATSASLGYASAVAVSAAGNIFIADTGNSRIREISASVPALAATFSVDPVGSWGYYLGQGDADSRDIQIGALPGLAWQATATTISGGPWLKLSSAAGQGAASLTAAIDSGSLAPGNYQGAITLRAPGAVPPLVTINVMLQVYLAPTEIYQISQAASGYFSGQNGAGIAPGSIFNLSGYHLGPTAGLTATSFPLSLNLGGTSVQINMSGVNYDAPILSTSYRQVSAMLPSTVPVGDGVLVMTYSGTASAPVAIHVVKSMFGIYTISNDGAGSGVIRDANNQPLTFDQPAHPGDIVTLVGTGLGAVYGDENSGPLPGNLFQAEVFVGKQPATLQYAGRSGCCAGMDEIALQIPDNVQGCFVPLAVRVSSVVSNFVTLPVAAAGESCFDPVGATPDLFGKATGSDGLKFGAIGLGPLPVLSDFGLSLSRNLADQLSRTLGVKVPEQDVLILLRAIRARNSRALNDLMLKYAPILRARKMDTAALVKLASEMKTQGVWLTFQNGTIPLPFAPEFGAILPSPGTCMVSSKSLFATAASVGKMAPLDAGAELSISAPGASLNLDRDGESMYQQAFPTGSANLSDGTYVVSSNGGADVGAFTAAIQVGPVLTWSNKGSVLFVDRSAPLTITWAGGPPLGYVVFGGEAATDDGVDLAFACVEDIRNQTLTVPDFVLNAMPHASASRGLLFLSLHPMQNRFSAPGLDVGFIADLSSDYKGIGFQ